MQKIFQTLITINKMVCYAFLFIIIYFKYFTYKVKQHLNICATNELSRALKWSHKIERLI